METSDNFGTDRKGRRGELDYRYDFLFHWAAESCSITKQDVIDSLLQEIWVRDIHDFVLKDTKRTVLLFYQAFHDPHLKCKVEKSNRLTASPNKTLVVVNDERKYPLDGVAVYYFKLNVKKMLTEDNVHRDLMVGMLDAMDEELLNNFIQLLNHIYRPALESLLFFADEGPEKSRVYEEVLMAIQSLYSSLKVSENILKHDNTLLAQRQVDLELPDEAKKRADYIRHPDTVAKAEKIATDWLSMIERENCESEMLRRDCDDDSPRDEIEYWKTRSTRLNLIQQQFNSPEVAQVVQCLNVNRSKLMRRWVEALRKLTHCCHEANNNTLYLNDFEHHCKTLYVWDPIRLLPTINQLLSTVRLICCVSLYYNTSERITSLLVKITNELIRSCRRHITNHGRETVWSRPAAVVKPLLEDCLNLHTAYRNAYSNMKQDLESYQKSVQQSQINQPTAKEQATLTCSEHSVFGKFDAFCSRLKKILRLYDVIEKHENLLKSRMEGLLQEEEVMDEILRRYHAAVKDITSRPYDYLNHRMSAFDQHMSEFEARLNDLKLYVGSYLERAYDPVWETAQAMRFLQKFQRIGRVIPVVAMEIKHNRILNQLLADMDRLGRVLFKFGDEPPIPRNFSSTTGKMMWCATLQRCLELRLEEHAPILHSETGRQVFRKYKNLLVTIVQLGNNLLRSWSLLSVTDVETCLSQTILTTHAEQPHLFSVNFNPKIIMLFQEIHCACQAGLRVPASSAFIFSRKGLLLKMKDEAQYLVESHKRLLDSIAFELRPLLCCHVHQLYLTLRPASVVLSWNIKQTKWGRFFNQCRKSMESFKLLCQRLEDIRINQLDRLLESLRHFSLCPDSRDKTWTPEEFVDAVKDSCRKATSEIQQRNWLLENGVFELIELVRVKDATKFFTIPTEAIAARIDSKGGRMSYPSGAQMTRPKSIGPERNKSKGDSVSETTRTNKNPSITENNSQSVEKQSNKRRPSGGDRGLPPLNPNGLTTKPPPAPPKPNQTARTKLPKLTSKKLVHSKEKTQPTSLPPLSARSSSSIVSVTQELASRKNSVNSNEGRDESANTVVVADYGFLVVQLEKAIIEWKRLYSKRILQVIVTWLRSQIDQMRYSVAPPPNHKVTVVQPHHPSAMFLLHSHLNQVTIELNPSLDDIQDIIHSAGKIMLCVAKGVKRWQYRNAVETTSSPLSAVQRYNIYASVAENKEIAKGLNLLSTCLIHVKSSYGEQLRQWEQLCKEICCFNRRSVVKNFVDKNPSVWDWDQQLRQFRQLEDVVESQKSLLEFGPIHVSTTKLQATLLQEIQEWMEAYTTVLYRRTLRDMERLMVVFNLLDRKLDRKIRDLEDTRISMECLRDIRIQEVEFEMAIELVEEAIGIMMKYHVPLTEEDVERVDAVRITWHRLQQRSLEHHCNLVAIQPNFRQELLDNLTQFRVDCSQFCIDYDRDGPMIQGLTPREASDRLLMFQNRFDALWRRLTSYEGGAELFGLMMPDVPELNRIRKELNLLQKLYRLYNDVIDRVAAYHDISWNSVNIEDINNELIEFQNRCRKLPKGLKEWPAFGALKRTIDEFSDLCPLLELMTNKAMKPRHWVRMTEITGHVFHVELEGFCLRQVVEAPLLQHKEDVEDVCISALKEKDIEAKLRQVTNDWTTNQLTFTTFKNRGELLLRGDSAAELISMLEDSLMVLSSLLSNRYNVPFRKQIQKWVTDLSNTNEILERWLMVQNLWVYLEAVFVGGDIAKQLPKEAKRFHKIDKSWQRMMARAHETSNVVICCVGDETLSQLLPHLQDELELCQKSLSGYLEKKRLSFPRFFFVSDPALLEILGQASDSHTIQGHLLSIFDNTACVKFHEQEYDKILAIVSTEGESIALEQPVRAEGSVELWLMRLLQEAHRSLHSIIRLASQAIQNTEFNLLEFLAAFPSQVGILGLQMLWTRDAELALSQSRYDRKVMQETNAKFLEVLNTLIEQTTKNLDRLERIKFETLITIHVHQRDIFDQLCRSGVRSITDFEWIKQFRFYFKAEHDQMAISITDVSFTYQNEFLGCTERLVITPLTDRCYITLAQALHMCMGGCPSGPAGTGKTETTKDMGKTLGKYVVVFNCSDQMDFRGLGRIYKGLAQSGSWGCFDEFNRIELAVLSVAAQQIAVVLACKREKKKQLIFTDGDTIEMNPEFGIFLTMNPGYAGRQQLPENLKNQFRFVSMMVPDRQIIIRVKLASCGFLENITLARKFYTLYKLCEEQLTKQVHYDFGLRNILSVLRTLGATKRQNVRDSESMIVMRVLRDMNLSKLVDEDEPLFMSLIGDLFPTTALEKTNYAELEAAIREQVKAAGLIMHPPWLLKLIQLYETQLVRHGIMTLGPTGSGKTTCIQILMKALTVCGQPHRELRMNPKAISAAQMFGRLDVATNDWTDGIFSALWRKTLRTKRGEHIWLVLDGPVDSLWIENLNSVLDDNRTLTLANGDRLPMSPYCKIIFEPHNIDNASPATVSRCGMVYMSSSGLDWRPLLAAWLLKRPSTEVEILRNAFEESFSPIYQWSRQSLHYMMDVLEFNVINQALALLEGLIPSDENEHKETNYERTATGPAADLDVPLDIPELTLDLKILGTDAAETTPKSGTTPRVARQQLERLYVFSVVWSIGAFLEKEDRAKLDKYLTTHFSHLALPPRKPNSEETIFDFVVGTDGEWEHWRNHVSTFQYPETTIIDFASMLVPNVDSVRTEFLLNTIAKQGKPVLLIGEQGSAKTVMINAYLKKHKNDNNLMRALNFSSATTTSQFQRTIEGCVDKRMGNTYGPPAGKKLTVFIDDINLPHVNEWGDQSTNEIVRQLLEMKGFYSLEKPGDFTNIIDLQFVAAMIHPGGGRNDIPQRLKRHFCIFNCPLPSDSSMDKVFGTIALGHFSPKRGFCQEVRELIEKLVPLTRLLWMATKAKMLPTPAKFHYIFNLRDLSRIWQGMSGFLCNVIDTTKVLMAAWKHEVTRVIADRFTVQTDKDWFEKELISHVARYLGEDYVETVQDSQYFVDFMRDAPEPTGDETEEVDMELPKVYEPVQSLDDLQERLTMFLNQYNDMIRGHGMDLVFFQDAVEHLIKISRILRHPGGNVLLVGVGGSGKQSLTKLASFIAGYKTFHITLTRSYNVGNFLEDLKVLYRTCGIQGKGTTFIFTDQDVKEEAFLEYLNSVLSSGIVSNLFNRDEQGEIISELTPVMKREFPKRDLTPETVMEYFMSRVRQHLHIALCFSPVGEKFRQRSFKFPGLISGCTLDWFQPWPREALVAVARHFLADFTLLSQTDLLHEVENALGSIQECVAETAKEYFLRFRRSTHVTPKTYLSFLASYKTVFGSKASEIGGMSTRIETGLAKLQDASETVEKLKTDLAVMEKELALASETAEKVLIEVTHRAREAETTKNHVQLAKDRAQRLVDVIAADKAVAEQKLEAARPALEEAEAALNTIKPAHIATVRKLGRPPPLIMRIMDAVLILFQRKIQPICHEPSMGGFKPSWNESLKMMASTTFLQQLQNFPKDTISDETVELLEPYFRGEDYNMETAKRVCGDVAGLLSWTRAMAFFFTVNKEVLPLKANLALQEVRLSAAMAELAKAEDVLSEKEKALDFVTSQYDSAMADKKRLTEAAAVCRRKMAIAASLISGLSGEKLRWTLQCRAFKEQIGRLVGDAILATAFLSYAGPFNQEFRTKIFQSWKKTLKNRDIPFTPTLNVAQMMSDNVQMAEWTLQGLPSDDHSIQNAVIVIRSHSYPLLIDPQGQGKNWIKAKEGNNELQITSLNHKYFRAHLDDALSLGRPLLIEDIGEELDPVLDNLLNKNFIRAGSTDKVIIGDKDCDIMPGFTLYITTKLPNPAYTPEVSSKVTMIDFTVTQRGLEDQLLARVVSTERSELEAERVSLFESVMENKRLIQQLEDNLLFRLTSTSGSLIDDEDLLAVLHDTKMTAQEVNHKLVVAAEMEHKINTAREEFRPVATRGSILYFLIVEMSHVNVMYQTSLKQFLHLFDGSLTKAMRTPNILERVNSVLSTLNREVWGYTLRGLYEHHQFLFTLLMAIKIDLHAGAISHAEFMKLIKGGASLDLNTAPPKPFKWILDAVWLNLVELSTLHPFTDLLQQIHENEREWRTWVEKERPEQEEIPCGYSKSLSLVAFRKLLLIRSWCPDRMLQSAQNYVIHSLGPQFIDAPLLDLEAMWGESEPRIPLICILTTCSDPSQKIESLARQKDIEIKSLSMGQGQEVHARRLLGDSMTHGNWLLLQNCHLNLTFCHELLESLMEGDYIHPNFRLWITTEVHQQFPISLLQTAIKFTNEPPQGIRASLKRTFTDVPQDLLDYSPSPAWPTLVYTVAFLHTVLMERRKYGPLGWNTIYEFNQSDLIGAIQCVQNHLDDMDPRKGISWPTICFMIGEAQYGGRVTDDFDKRLLLTFTSLWFSDRLLAPGFEFYVNYPLPSGPYIKSIAGSLEHVATLPATDSPHVLGLDSNAEVTYQMNRAQAILDTILSIQPKEGGNIRGGETRESVVYRLADDMLEKMPKNYIDHEVKEALNRMGPLLPMAIFLRQELDRMQRVIHTVRRVLLDLKLAIEGTIIMSPHLLQAMDAMYDARVPEMWKSISWESSTLGFWFTEFLERNTQFTKWIFQGKPKVFWIAGFFNPQGFLTAMRQEVTRAHRGWALDSVVLQSVITRLSKEEVTEHPAEGVYIHGMYLEGASLDRKTGKLVETKGKILYEPMPVIYVYAINSTAGKDPKSYECPIYRKPIRSTTTYIGSIDLETDVNSKHWTLRGVALLCDIK